MINGFCVQVSCAIHGQQSINGVCQCVNINSIIQACSCVCPLNSQVVGIACVCSIIGQTMQNGQCVCPTTGAFVLNNTCTCGINSLNTSNKCSCPANSSLNTVSSACTCDIIIGQSIVDGFCQCPTGKKVINDQCYYVINVTQFECHYELFTQTFDIQSITNQIAASDFDAGYVFSTPTIIQNAFIDISDNVYSTTVYPLFISQNTFTNLKIRFGTQSLNSGSLILSTSSFSINQMNIISRPGSQLTVNSAQQLNILASSSSNTGITNLLVNLSFAPSNGNITLINYINGAFNVSGYQVLGSYLSTGTVAMIGININSATINVNQVSFKPTAFNAGNSSSYLFGNVATTSTIQINYFAVIIGSSYNFLLFDSISTSSSNYYRFGGIIAYINGNSVVNVNNLILDSYQKFTTSQVSKSGFLVGENINSISSSITIQNVCLQQNMTSTTTQFQFFGLIGYNQGNTYIQNALVSFSVQSAYFTGFGIIGYQEHNSNSIQAEIINLIISVNVSLGGGIFVGSLFGTQYASNCSIQNTKVVGGNISSNSSYVGGFIGAQVYNTQITNSSLQQSVISGLTYIGGFVGYFNYQLLLTNSNIQFVTLVGSGVGIVAGNFGSSASFLFTSSWFAQINVNGVLRSDCAVISNTEFGC
ncbi:Conserved_hypothetical protein [Hexamita inflata]|uniref:Transmembrane protein n=1 Tax=Hexamita inflata TaxID=28002 RepID=A0AA86QW06_9EUKA|nr:Conserved hypothetical protein [Hexamita inflata]